MVDLASVSKVQLRFALSSGELVGIRAFDAYRGLTSGRPSGFTCPQCKEEVCLVLPTEEDPMTGKRIADHFRHLPDAACSVRNGGESAVHLNAKAFLTQKLRAFQSVSLIHYCEKCQTWTPYLTIGNYERVQPEWAIGQRRPDIACLDSEGLTIGAVEIRHTHAVDEAKKAEFKDRGLIWFEVSATQILAGWHFTESGDTLSIDGRGADVTYPVFGGDCQKCDYQWNWVKDIKTMPPAYRLYARLVKSFDGHDFKCPGIIKEGDGVLYCGRCGSYQIAKEIYATAN